MIKVELQMMFSKQTEMIQYLWLMPQNSESIGSLLQPKCREFCYQFPNSSHVKHQKSRFHFEQF